MFIPPVLNTASLPPRPKMPGGQDEQDRADHQRARWLLLDERHEDIALDWMGEHMDEDRLDNMGPPDLSANPLADICRQLSTPGLYGYRPTVSHQDPAAVAMIGPGAAMDRGGYWTKMQVAQLRTLGLGDYLMAPTIEGGELGYRFVHPHNVWTRGALHKPDVPIELWEMQLRYWADLERWVYTWTVHDVSGPTPRRWVRLANETAQDLGVETVDVTAQLEPTWTATPYPWVGRNGRARVPYTVYRSVDGGRSWNHLDKRGAHRGTLTAIMNWTAAGHAALHASGEMVIIGGLKPLLDQVDIPAGQDRQVVSIKVTPGMLAYHEVIPGQTPFVQTVGPGAHVETLANYAALYESKQAVRWGLNPSDALRQSANPWSGAALYIANKGKRDFSAMVEPMFRRADLDMLELSAMALRQLGVVVPETGYSISYAPIELSPDEMKSAREEDEWAVARGLKSRVDLYMERHPGVSREHALQALARARADELLIEQLATVEITRQGAPT